VLSFSSSHNLSVNSSITILNALLLVKESTNLVLSLLDFIKKGVLSIRKDLISVLFLNFITSKLSKLYITPNFCLKINLLS
jgi:hypothetical protein